MNLTRLVEQVRKLTGKDVLEEAQALASVIRSQGFVADGKVNTEKLDSFSEGWPENDRYALLGLAIGVAGSR